MKRAYILLLCLFIPLVFACGGAKKTVKAPAHLTSGAKGIHKGIAWYQKGCNRRALEYFLNAHELFSATDQQKGVAMSLNSIGSVYRNMADTANALLFFEAAFEIYSNLNEVQRMVHVLSNKAAAYIDDDRLKAAEAEIVQAEALSKSNALSIGPILLRNRAVLSMKRRDFAKAETLLSEAQAAANQLNPAQTAPIDFAFGKLMLKTDRFDQALAYFESAFKADQFLGYYTGMADDLAAMGDTYFKMEANAKAADHYQRSLKIYALIQNNSKVSAYAKAFKEAAKKSGMDTRLTERFVEEWLEGPGIKGPCN